MIYSITGLLRQVAPNYCVVEACGVGYRCSASTYTLSSLPGKGQEVTLLTHLWVKEDGVELFHRAGAALLPDAHRGFRGRPPGGAGDPFGFHSRPADAFHRRGGRQSPHPRAGGRGQAGAAHHPGAAR